MASGLFFFSVPTSSAGSHPNNLITQEERIFSCKLQCENFQGRLDSSGLDHIIPLGPMTVARQVHLRSKDQPALCQISTLRSTAVIEGPIWTLCERTGVDEGVGWMDQHSQGHWGNWWDQGSHFNLSPTISVDNIICQCFLSTIVGTSLLVRLKSNSVLLYFKKRDSFGALWSGRTLE